MSDILTDFYNACHPLIAASPAYYVDCTKVRGNNPLVKKFLKKLERSNSFLCFLFSGHIGGGKSSELQHLSYELARPHSLRKRYLPIYLDTLSYLDVYDVSTFDLLLAVVVELADVFRNEVEIELKPHYFTQKFQEMKEFFLRHVDVAGSDVDVWKGAKLKLELLKRDPDNRQKLRNKLVNEVTPMLEAINELFSEARQKLRAKQMPDGTQYADFVLMLDNLEKL